MSSLGFLHMHCTCVGLSDPWSTAPAEPPPSYDTVTGAVIRDPWSAMPSTEAEPASQTGTCHNMYMYLHVHVSIARYEVS